MESQQSPAHARRRKHLGLVLAGVMALAAGGALVIAHGGGNGGGAGRGPMHHGLGFPEMSEHFREHVKQVLAEVDATPEQQARIQEIVQSAANDLKSLHAQHAGGFAEIHALFTAPAIDRGRLEQLRARHIAALDAASQRCAAAMADAAEVLTPEQRAKLGARAEKRHGGFSHGD
jgi:Spy/CpxP family protein refolding chaperone